jgi:hypothetical protein
VNHWVRALVHQAVTEITYLRGVERELSNERKNKNFSEEMFFLPRIGSDSKHPT